MKMAVAPKPVTQPGVGRADLLRLLALWGDGSEELAAALTGFRYRSQLPETADPRKGRKRKAKPPVQPNDTPVVSGFQAKHYTAIVSKSDEAKVPPDFESRLKFADGPQEAPLRVANSAPPKRIALSESRRLTVFAEKHLRKPHPANQWDASLLIKQLVRGLPPNKRKARKQRLRWAGSVLVIQMSEQTVPLQEDAEELAALVHQRSGGRVPIYLHYRGLGWSVYEPGSGNRVGRPLPQVWRDLTTSPKLQGMSGLALGWPLNDERLQMWEPTAMLTAWQPLNASWSLRLPIAYWDVNQRLQTRRQVPLDGMHVPPERLRELLALMALALHITPSLLRALRCMLNLPAAAEVQAWGHPDVGCNGVAIALRPRQRDSYIAPLKALPLALRQQAAECIAAHHVHLSPAIASAESMLAQTHAPGAKVIPADRQFQQWASSLLVNPETDESLELGAFLTRQGHRTDAATWQHSPEFVLAWAVANAEALHDPGQLPEHFPLNLLGIVRAKVLHQQTPATLQGLRLRQQDGDLHFDLCDAGELLQATHVPANVLAHWTSQPVMQMRSALEQPWRRLALEPGMSPINLDSKDRLELTDGNFSCVVESVQRPSWAIEWARDRQGLYVLVPNPWGVPKRITWPQSIPSYQLEFIVEPKSGGRNRLDSLGLYIDQIGPLAAITLGKLNQQQSFRYLPPGRFLMGSPPDEDERWRDEGPQHWVTLTQGLWLADTACTQGLWQAVMGDNPSHFQGDPDLPVESVSWDDVQSFLQKLQAYLPPGVEACLPTEAEWEYACRAGSTSAFSFGDTITPDQVNYNGNYPYRSAPKGEYRGKTVPVKALPANDWGLYQMHGNVWEWCADGLRDYTAHAVSDPSGATGKEQAQFAVRGGACNFSALDARSAQRSADHRDGRHVILGFRFALRSQVQEQGGGAPDWWVQRTQAFTAAQSAEVVKGARSASGSRAPDGAPSRGGTPRLGAKSSTKKARK